MIDLSTSYLGLKLKNPIIAASSGLTNSVENIIELEKKGVAAVVLKSLFEEQIRQEASSTYNTSSYEMPYAYAEAHDYISNYSKDHALSEYLTLIKESKKAVSIPVISSIN
ncbi:MAG: diguanylate cyclase, partial [Bacteroidales bacterium]|nr:diguanylate cyclase [Bacteroidales bacterium]